MRHEVPARLACDCLRDVSEDQALSVAAKISHGAYCNVHGIQTILQVQVPDGRWMPHDIPMAWRGLRVI